MESLRIASSTSFEDRTELVHGELYREIKKNENCILAERMIQQLRVEIRIDQDVFDEQTEFAIIYDPGLWVNFVDKI